MRVISKATKSHLERNMFFDGEVEIARYDQVKYPQFEKLTNKQLGFFWRPEEVDILRDSKDFRNLTESEQHIFSSNLKRQILLDSVQGRAPNLAFLPIVSLPELETWIETWSFSETIHSRSYTHIIRNIYTNPGDVFDTIMDIKPIVDCAKDIGKYYDNLIENPTKTNLWLALNSVNALEGVRFYVSFACSWAFAELKKMEGNAKIIKLICRDENIHLGSTQQLLKLLPIDDPEFITVKNECKEQVEEMFDDVVKQEKEWADYLFKDGSMIGLNADVLKEYVDWIANKRRIAIGMQTNGKGGTNPLPWTQKWIAGGEVQVAPQETEITSYVIGGVKKDVEDNTFAGMSL